MATLAINPDTTFDRMLAAMRAGDALSARQMAGKLRKWIVAGGTCPDREHAGDTLLAALAPDCTACGARMTLYAGVWACDH